MGARIPDAMGGKGEETRRRLALSEAVVERLETALADKSRALEATIAELRAAPSRDEQMTEMREKLEAATRETESLRASTLALASTRAPSDPEEDAALAVRVATAEGSLATSRARLDVAETALAEWRTHAEARSKSQHWSPRDRVGAARAVP
jgi:chromosome segregation ATPase